MTRGDIIRELGWPMRFGMDSELLDRIERVVRLAEAAAVAEEREAAAKECEKLLPSKRIFDQRYFEAVEDCVATIRARGEK